MTLRALILAIFLAVLAPSASEAAVAGKAEVKRMVVQEAMRSRSVAPALALAVAKAESNFRTDAESRAGARGVMQLMPATAKGEFGAEADELWEPRLNIQLGIAFLDDLLDRYDGRLTLVLSHYNGGSAVMRNGMPRVIPATRAYVRRVLKLYRRYRSDPDVAKLVRDEGAANPGLKMQFALQDHPETEATTRPTWKRYLAVASAALSEADAEPRTNRVRTSDALNRLIDATRRKFRDSLRGTAG